jgi:hypothetical protein
MNSAQQRMHDRALQAARMLPLGLPPGTFFPRHGGWVDVGKATRGVTMTIEELLAKRGLPPDSPLEIVSEDELRAKRFRELIASS